MKKRIISLLVVALMLITSVANAQALKWDSGAGFNIYSFSYFGLMLNIGMVTGGPTSDPNYQPNFDDSSALVVTLEPGHRDGYGNWFGFYPTFSSDIAEGLRLFGRIRIRIMGSAAAASSSSALNGYIRLDPYSALASWTISEGLTLTLGLGIREYFDGAYDYFGSAVQLSYTTDMIGFSFALGTKARAADYESINQVSYATGEWGGLYVNTANTYRIRMNFVLVPMEMLFVGLTLKYDFNNTSSWSSFYEYGDPAGFAVDNPTLSVTNPIQGRTYGAAGTPYRQKAGTLTTFLQVAVEMKDLLYFSVTGYANLGLSLGDYIYAAGFTFDLLMVPNMLVELWGTFESYGANRAEVDGWMFAPIDNRMDFPIGLTVEYTLDMGFKIVPYLYAAADIAGVLFYSGTAYDPTRTWYVEAGVRFKVGPNGAFEIPLSFRVTNFVVNTTYYHGNVDKDIYSITNIYDLGGDPALALTTKLFICFGLSAAF